MTRRIVGTGASPGVAVAPALVLAPPAPVVAGGGPRDPAEETARLAAAFERALAENRRLGARARQAGGGVGADIFLAHREILLDDFSLRGPILERIEREGFGCEGAIAAVCDELADSFAQMEDAYLRERAADFRDIKNQLLRALSGAADAPAITGDCILVAEDLTPSDTARLDLARVKGLVTEGGGRTSHTAILANTMGLPAVVGAAGVLAAVADGDALLMDGETGTVLVRPDAEALAAGREKMAARAEEKAALAVFCRGGTQTADGAKLALEANIGAPGDVAAALAAGAEGIGLFRSEFLFLGREELPDEEAQFQAYRAVLEACKSLPEARRGLPVTVRTLDVGGDKPCPALGLAREDNSFLGLRGIRFSLHRQDVFLTQLRALARVGACGDLRVMLPMVSRLEELREARVLYAEAAAQARAAGHPVAERLPLGVMIEVPAAAVMAEAFAGEADFFSLGTNDLAQYTAAVDRDNPGVAALYSPCEPAHLRLVAHTVQAAAKAGIPCGMCGEAAGTQALLPLWLGMGLGRLSMGAGRIPALRALAARLEVRDCEALAKAVAKAASRAEVEALLAGFAREHGG